MTNTTLTAQIKTQSYMMNGLKDITIDVAAQEGNESTFVFTTRVNDTQEVTSIDTVDVNSQNVPFSVISATSHIGMHLLTKHEMQQAAQRNRSDGHDSASAEIRERIIGYAEGDNWDREQLNTLLTEIGMEPKTSKFNVTVEYGGAFLEFEIDADADGIDDDEDTVREYVEEHLDVSVTTEISWSGSGDWASDSTEEDDTSFVSNNWYISVERQ